MKHDHPGHDASQCEVCRNRLPFEIPAQLYESLLKGDVVLFVGAGVSTENREVMPYTFYEDVCGELSLAPQAGVSFPNVMSKYADQPNGRAKLLRKIKERLDYVHSFAELEDQATAFHRELSTIFQIDSVITTNWDNYFEQECGATKFVSPEDFVFWNLPGRKVLKIHGSVDSYGSLIVTDQDYKRCYKELSRGLLGSRLKVDLATKTLVYVGFSFSDPDFLKIHRILTSEMKGLRPVSYIVSLDTASETRFKKEGLSPVFTDGTYFLGELKKRLVADRYMFPDAQFDGISAFLLKLQQEHTKLAKAVDIHDYPALMHCLSYQDGLQHALKRILTMRKTGYYSNPYNPRKVAWDYHNIVRPEKLKAGKYADVAYIDGYADGHIYLLMDKQARRGAPLYFAFGYNGQMNLKTLEQYLKVLKRTPKLHRKAYAYAKNLLKKTNFGKGLVFHHRCGLF